MNPDHPCIPGRPTVCLNMIVRDEAHVIARCLASVRPYIDCWVIVDTGSTDGTQALVRNALKDLPGQLHERPWKNFGDNRSEAIALAAGRADYLLFIDADDYLVARDGFRLPVLYDDVYRMVIRYGAIEYQRPVLVRAALGWHYKGVLHEYLESAATPASSSLLAGLCMQIEGGGGRSQIDTQTKYARDADILEKALIDEPDNARYVFYLAQSYRDSGQLEKSLAAYGRRAAMPGFVEEAYCALLESARICRRLGRSSAEVADRYLQAYASRPQRAEAIGELARYHREAGPSWHLAHLFAERAATIALPPDVLFVERAWYEWCSLDELAIAAYWIGEWRQSREACERLLGSGLLPPEQRPRVLANLNFARDRLGLAPTVG
ncbi:MAG: glycosyltransferase [Panacagrimonas sp.]